MNDLTGVFGALGLAAAAVTATVWTLVHRSKRRRQARSATLIGKTCVIQSPAAGRDLGHAKVPSPRGKARVIPVRGTADDGTTTLAAGAEALIYDYDNTGEFYLVARLAHRPHDGKSSAGQPE